MLNTLASQPAGLVPVLPSGLVTPPHTIFEAPLSSVGACLQLAAPAVVTHPSIHPSIHPSTLLQARSEPEQHAQAAAAPAVPAGPHLQQQLDGSWTLAGAAAELVRSRLFRVFKAFFHIFFYLPLSWCAARVDANPVLHQSNTANIGKIQGACTALGVQHRFPPELHTCCARCAPPAGGPA
jgi:hypothetical protein